MNSSSIDIFFAPTIELGRGLGPVRFGMSPEETLNLLGSPEGLDLRHPKKGYGALVHQYPKLGINFTFDEEDDHRLTYIDVVAGNYKLMEQLALGMTWDDSKAALKQLGLGIPSEERCSSWDLLCLHHHSLICWFQKGVLTKLSFGHYWSKEGQPLWPEV